MIRRLRYVLSSTFLAWGVALIPDGYPRAVMNQALNNGVNTMMWKEQEYDDDGSYTRL